MAKNGNTPEDYTVELTTFLYGGEVLGRLPDGRAVFVPFTLPGERVRIRLVKEKKNFARAELLEVIEPARHRIEPRCIHFGVCGGCQYQHMSYQEQLEAKTAILQDQLERIGKLKDIPIRSIIPSPDPYNYRNHIQFHLDADGRLGFYRADGQGVLAIRECHLPEPVLNSIWPQLDFEPLSELERIGLRAGNDDHVQLILESSSIETPELSVEDFPVSVMHLSEAGPLVLAGSEAVVIEVKGRPFRVSGGSFFQVNTAMAEAMVEHLLEHLELQGDELIYDVYCGAGLFSAFLAERCGRLVGVEASPQAAEDFMINLDAFDHVELYEAPAEEVLPVLRDRPAVVLVDPPRAGLDLRALDGLLELAPPTLVYISCDPATLARDARRLARGGYQLRQVTPFDVFPQTYHIESISFWDKS